MLGTDTGGSTVGTAEGNVTDLGTTGHVVGLSTRVDNLVDRLHGKVHGHELTDGLEASEGSTNTETSETHLGNGGINDSALAKAIEETTRNLVGTVVLANLLTHEENVIIFVHLLGDSGVEGISDSHLERAC